MVQWLKLSTCNAGDVSLIPGPTCCVAQAKNNFFNVILPFTCSEFLKLFTLNFPLCINLSYFYYLP